MDTNRDERLRQRAYHIWERDGRPEGLETEHWARAERELAHDDAGAIPAATSRSRGKAPKVERPAGLEASAPVKKKAASPAPKTAPRMKKN